LKIQLSKFFISSVFVCVSATAIAGDGTSGDELLRDADQVFQQLDQGLYGDLWENSAPFVHGKLSKEKFVNDTQQVRQSLGVVTKRGWASIVRTRITNATNVPDGLYANLDFSSVLANGHTVYELLSFRLEPDGLWHLTGYTPRRSQEFAK